MEMFPSICTLEVSHCLTLMGGDIEKAAQLIMHRQESGQSLQPGNVKTRNGSKFCKPAEIDDKSMKRYNYFVYISLLSAYLNRLFV